jgi:hypothetical protein
MKKITLFKIVAADYIVGWERECFWTGYLCHFLTMVANPGTTVMD